MVDRSGEMEEKVAVTQCGRGGVRVQERGTQTLGEKDKCMTDRLRSKAPTPVAMARDVDVPWTVDRRSCRGVDVSVIEK